MKRWIIMTVGLVVGLLAGCAHTETGDGRFVSADGAEMPQVSAPHASADESRSPGYQPPPARAVVTLHAVGRGIAPVDAVSRGQAILLGEGAARADGYVRLAEKIHGVYVDSYRHLGRGGIDIDMVYQETQAWLRGAEVIEYKQVEHGIFEAHMRVKVVVPKGHPLYPPDI
ncbi:hypothetical protein [Desulfatiferula olefinivorans]